MTKFVTRRILALFPVLISVSIISFLMLHFIPGDPAEVLGGIGASGQDIARIREQLGLDQAIHIQYWIWLKSLIGGDLGTSLITRESISEMISFRLVNTLKLTIAGIAFATVAGMLAGIVSAVRRNTILDYLAMAGAIFGVSMPVFWIGLMLMLVFSIWLGWLPAVGAGGLSHIILPAITIGVNSTAIIARMTRSSMLEVICSDYIRTAQAKGCAYRTTIYKHALRNAMNPIITTIGLQFGYLMGGAVLTETVFVWPGIGRLLVDSVFKRDFPVVQILLLIVATSFVVVNFAVDLLYGFFDPRTRYD